MTESAATWTHEQRSDRLALAISRAAADGYRVESRSEYDAVLVRGHRINHILHLILSITTFGMWTIVWIFLAVTGGEKRATLHVDKQGQVATTWVE